MSVLGLISSGEISSKCTEIAHTGQYFGNRIKILTCSWPSKRATNIARVATKTRAVFSCYLRPHGAVFKIVSICSLMFAGFIPEKILEQCTVLLSYVN